MFDAGFAAVAILVLGVVGFLTWPDSESPVAEEPSLASEEETIQQLLSTRDYSVLEGLVTEDWLSTDVDASPYPNRQELMEDLAGYARAARRLPRS